MIPPMAWVAFQATAVRQLAGELPGRICQIIGWSLIASAFSDGLIVLVQILGARYLQPWIISIYSSTTLILIGVLTLSGALSTSASEPEEDSPSPR